jgi:hypothetical protein
MSKSFHFKKDDYESAQGAKKHRFNAEYSDEYESDYKKKQKIAKRKSRRETFDYTDLH